jgi:hypothetical protein
LLRKCWGVAGSDIITSNLKRTKDGKTVVFNPTVPGKRVYALFGFVAIDGFSDQDVMILINDVANVVHDEVYQWALGDSGQVNATRTWVLPFSWSFELAISPKSTTRKSVLPTSSFDNMPRQMLKSQICGDETPRVVTTTFGPHIKLEREKMTTERARYSSRPFQVFKALRIGRF